MNALDYIFLAIIILFSLICLIKGFVNEVFGKAAFVFGILGAVFFYADAGNWFANKIESSILRNILGFIVIFVIIFVVIKVIGLVISKIFEINVLKSLDRIFGLVFGFLEGAAIVGLIIFLLQIQPFFDSSKILNDSYIYSIFVKIISNPEIQGVLPNNV